MLVDWVLVWTFRGLSKQNTQWNTNHPRPRRTGNPCFLNASTDFHFNRRNHPETIVYCQDSSALLKHAVAVMNNEEPAPLPSKDGQTLCPPMPRKVDQIDFIFGGRYDSCGSLQMNNPLSGPPCQSFSKANHSKVSDIFSSCSFD